MLGLMVATLTSSMMTPLPERNAKQIAMQGSRMQCGAGKPVGGQRLLAVSMVASGQSFSRPPSRRWIGLVMMAIWTVKKTAVVAHLALVLGLKSGESITTMGIRRIFG